MFDNRWPKADPLRWAMVLWCETSAIAVILTGDIQWWLAAIILVLIPLTGLADDRSRWLGPLRALSSIAAIGYLLFFPVDWLLLSDRLIFAVVHLMFYLKVHTLLHLRTRKDRIRIYVLCLFEMLAAASMTITLAFIVPLVVFVLLGSLVLLLEQALGRAEAPAVAVPSLNHGSVLRSAAVLGTVVLLLAGIAFVLLPRSSQAGFRIGGVRGVTQTGLSENVRLGDFGVIKRSRDVVMRVVEVSPAPDSPSRWRGAAYDRYENGQWSKTLTGMSELPQPAEGVFLLNRPSDARRARSEVFLEPLDTDVLFLPPASLRLITPLPYVFVDPYLALHTGRAARAGRRYTVEWRTDAPAGATSLGAVWLGYEARQFYLQLPALSDDFHRLAEEILPDRRGPPLEMAASVERFLEDEYDYTLTTPSRVREDPLEDFVFETRAGHCEHFATAMVMMLRARDVPARLVTGFLRGQSNDLGNYELIRKENAHAWVEVFDRTRGWITFDPTPAAESDGEERTLAFVTKSIDSMKMLWDMYVIAFDYERQRGVLRGVGAGVEWIETRTGQALAWGWARARGMAGAALLGLAVLFVVVSRWGERLRCQLKIRWPFHRRRLPGGSPESSVRFYGELLAHLDRLGFRRSPGTTPAEFARSLEAQLPGLTELTGVYYRMRFGGVDPERDDLARAERLAAAIRLTALSGGDLNPGRSDQATQSAV